MSDKLTAELLSGLRIELADYTEWRVFQDIFVERHYESACKLAIKYGIWNSINVLDLGCNTGMFSFFAADQILKSGLQDFKIIGIDASEHALTQFKKRLENTGSLNISDKFDLGLGLIGKHSGQENFKEYADQNSSMSHLNPLGDKVIKYIDLDPIAGANGVCLLKCDIEGAEQTFIENYAGLLSKTTVAVFEFHHRIIDIEKCRNLLIDYGFCQAENITRGNVSIETFLNRERRELTYDAG